MGGEIDRMLLVVEQREHGERERERERERLPHLWEKRHSA